jgi:hypothetical protein
MIMNWGAGRNSAILGSSTHNQRIERVWRDVTKEVTFLNKNLFTYIEEQLHINFSKSDMLFVLHALFIPSINNDLESYLGCGWWWWSWWWWWWDLPSMRTSNACSPNQLFRLSADKSAAVTFDPDEYGIEYKDEESQVCHIRCSSCRLPWRFNTCHRCCVYWFRRSCSGFLTSIQIISSSSVTLKLNSKFVKNEKCYYVNSHNISLIIIQFIIFFCGKINWQTHRLVSQAARANSFVQIQSWAFSTYIGRRGSKSPCI